MTPAAGGQAGRAASGGAGQDPLCIAARESTAVTTDSKHPNSYLLHLPRQLAAPLLLLPGPVGLCELQPLDMEGAPVVEIAAVPQLAPRAAAPLERQRRACTGAEEAVGSQIGAGEAGLQAWKSK